MTRVKDIDLHKYIGEVITSLETAVSVSEYSQTSPEVSVTLKKKYGLGGFIYTNSVVEVFYEALRKIATLK